MDVMSGDTKTNKQCLLYAWFETNGVVSVDCIPGLTGWCRKDNPQGSTNKYKYWIRVRFCAGEGKKKSVMDAIQSHINSKAAHAVVKPTELC